MEYKISKTLVFVVILLVVISEISAKIAASCPSYCVCSLEKLSCQNENLTGLPEKIPNTVKIVDFSHNKLAEIPVKFSKFRNLESLILANNEIIKLDKTSLNIRSLFLLDVSSNHLQWIHIQPNTLNLTESIFTLDLSHNPLGFIQNTKNFLISKTLEKLIMKNTSIMYYFPYNFFSELTNLKLLTISDNSHLRQLNISSTSIEEIDASNCGLEVVHLENLPKLINITFKGSRVAKTHYLKNDNLQLLDLTDNGIKFIEINAFKDLPQLKKLDLSMNVFVDLDPNTFVTNTNLQTLFISRTYLKNFVKFNSPSLFELDLSYNEIQNFDDGNLSSMPALAKLNLCRNFISTLPNVIHSTSLQVLNLSSLQIMRIKEYSLKSLENLRFLDLSNNRLTFFHRSYFPKNLHDIELDNNLWRCECFSKEFKDQYDYLMHPYELTSKQSLMCHSPENVSGLTWEQACESAWDSVQKNLVQQGKMWIYVISMILALSVVFCATLCIRRMQKIKMMREQAERLRLRMEAQERINRLRRDSLRQREAQQNAPDPRELQRPPSYSEAIRMPRMDGSYSTIAGSLHSLTASRASLAASQSDLAKSRTRCRSGDDLHEEEGRERSGSKSGRPRRSRTPKGNRRRRRRSQVENSGDFDTQSVPDLATDDESHRSLVQDSERRETMESEVATNNNNNRETSNI